MQKKTRLFATQNSEIEQLKSTITQLKLKNTSVAPSITPDEKFLELDRRNKKLEEDHIKYINEIVNLKTKLTSISSSYKTTGSSSQQHSSSGPSSQTQSKSSSQHSREHSRDSSTNSRSRKHNS